MRTRNQYYSNLHQQQDFERKQEFIIKTNNAAKQLHTFSTKLETGTSLNKLTTTTTSNKERKI